MHAHSCTAVNTNATPEKSPETLDFSAMNTILEEHKSEMTKALASSPQTVEKKVLKELEHRNLLSPRIIKNDLNEALTESDGDDEKDPNGCGSTKHINLPKTGKKKTNRHSSFCQQGAENPK